MSPVPPKTVELSDEGIPLVVRELIEDDRVTDEQLGAAVRFLGDGTVRRQVVLVRTSGWEKAVVSLVLVLALLVAGVGFTLRRDVLENRQRNARVFAILCELEDQYEPGGEAAARCAEIAP